MNTDRTVVIENVSTGIVSLSDTQGHNYLLKPTGKMRISAATLLDILDQPGSKRIFNRGYMTVGNISRGELYNMGLTEEEINKILKEEVRPAIVITPAIEEEPEAVIEVVEPVVEEVEEIVEEPVVVEKPVTVAKPAAKKPASKKNSSKKGK
jgi:hypothetical protein